MRPEPRLDRTPGRPPGLDLARGLAVISMIVAHTSPWGGVLNLSEYLSAPWFAFLIGASLQLASDKLASDKLASNKLASDKLASDKLASDKPASDELASDKTASDKTASDKTGTRRWQFVLSYLARGVILILLGIGLQSVYAQIIVVLQTLGLLTIVLTIVLTILLAPLAGALRPWAAAAIAGLSALLSPHLMDASRGWLATGGSGSATLDYLVYLLAAGDYYRVSSALAFAAAGMACVPILARGGASGRRGLLTALALGLAAGVVYWLGKRSQWGADAYSGSTPEIIGATLLSMSATWACVWLADAAHPRWSSWLEPLEATGRMALTAYTVQILALAGIVAVWLPGQRDDHWWVLLTVIVLCVGSSWAWLARFRYGPLEALIRLPQRALARTGRSPTRS